jgi:hypothetical protein
MTMFIAIKSKKGTPQYKRRFQLFLHVLNIISPKILRSPIFVKTFSQKKTVKCVIFGGM